jgi:hypothetical protein
MTAVPQSADSVRVASEAVPAKTGSSVASASRESGARKHPSSSCSNIGIAARIGQMDHGIVMPGGDRYVLA